MLKLKELSVLFRKNIAPGGEISSARKEVSVSKKNKSYDDSVKLKRTEMDPFRLG